MYENDLDFRGSGWSRGHMAPAGNNKHSQAAMNQTFYLTNIVPQVHIVKSHKLFKMYASYFLFTFIDILKYFFNSGFGQQWKLLEQARNIL